MSCSQFFNRALRSDASPTISTPCKYSAILYPFRVALDDSTSNAVRFDLPESVATSQLGRLRELMLREARLLNFLCDEHTVPMELGWLEQRVSEFVSPLPCDSPSSSMILREDGRRCTAGRTLSNRSWSEQRSGGSSTALDERNMIEVLHWGASSVELPHLPASQNAASLLHYLVPWTVDEDDIEGDGHEVEGSQFQGEDQRRWGGDHSTDWVGIAEPKVPAGALGLFGLGANEPSGSRLPGSQEGKGRWARRCFDPKGFPLRMVCLSSYILMPDWVPLAVWFETKLDAQISSPGEDHAGGEGAAAAAPASGDGVWRRLVGMFLQVVRGVENLHVQGMVHNAIHPRSVWVSGLGPRYRHGRRKINGAFHATTLERDWRPPQDARVVSGTRFPPPGGCT